MMRIAPMLSALGAAQPLGVTGYKVSPLAGVLHAAGGAGQTALAGQQAQIQQAQLMRMRALMQSPNFHAMLTKMQSGDLASMTPGQLYMAQLMGMPEPQHFLGGKALGGVEAVKGNVALGAKETAETVNKGYEVGGANLGPFISGQATGAAAGQPLAASTPEGTGQTVAGTAAMGTYLRGLGIEKGGEARMQDAITNDKYRLGQLGIERTKAEAWAVDANVKAHKMVADIVQRQAGIDLKPDQVGPLTRFLQYVAGTGPFPGDADMKTVLTVPNIDTLKEQTKNIAAQGRGSLFGKMLSDRVATSYPGGAPQELLNAVAEAQQPGFASMVNNQDAHAMAVLKALDKGLPVAKGKTWAQTWKSLTSDLGFDMGSTAANKANTDAEFSQLQQKAAGQGGTLDPTEAARFQELFNERYGQRPAPSGGADDGGESE